MKTKNLFWGALTCLAFAACSDDDTVVNPNGALAEGENAYVAVQLVMAGGETRAWNNTNNNDNYADGLDYEVNVKNATFYFFNADGSKQVQEPQTITTSTGTVTDGTEGQLSFTDVTTNTGVTAQKESSIVLLLKDTEMPSQIAVVLNAPEEIQASGTYVADMTLTNLAGYTKDLSTTYTTDATDAKTGAYVMSNSVYVDGKVLKATPVKTENIGRGTTADLAAAEALEHPVVIPVERVLALVDVKYATSMNYYDNTVTYNGEESASTITPYITGWWLHNTPTQTTLIKDLSTSYTWSKYGTSTDSEGNEVTTTSETLNALDATEPWWNTKNFYRSYWANMYSATTGDVVQSWSAYEYNQQTVNPKYTFENTSEDNPTYVMVAAKLMDNNMQVVDLVQWVNFSFKSLDDFKKYMATRLGGFGYTIKDSDDAEARELTASDFVEYYNTGATGEQPFGTNEDWKAGLTIATGSTLYQNGVEIDDAKKHLAEANVIGAFKHYAKGQTYYFVKIQHNPDYEETKYAVIRNHKYVVTISGITGLGTPVPNPNDDDPTDPTNPTPDPGTDPDPEPDPTPDPDPDPDPDQPLDPETPTDDHSALDAQILIMKYRVVSQDVTLDNQK